MSKLIVNVETGEETLVPLSEEDIAQQKIDEAADQAKLLEEQAEEEAKAQAKAAAQAKLAALGLTISDLKALGL